MFDPPPAAAPASTSRRADFDTKRFDGGAYAGKALALARSVYADAALVSFDVNNVFPTGIADLGLTDQYAVYSFRSPSHSAPREGAPKNLDDGRLCYVRVEVGARDIDVRAVSNTVDPRCRLPIRALPKCTFRQIWDKAKASGADGDTIARLSFLRDGIWLFDNSFDNVGMVRTFSDRCP